MGFDTTAATHRDAKHYALVQVARHLRWEHGLSRRKVAKRLQVRERWVKEYVDAMEGEEG